MMATYAVSAHETDEFLRIFRADYANLDIIVTVKTGSSLKTSQNDINTRILRTIEAENSGGEPFKTMSIDEMENMAS